MQIENKFSISSNLIKVNAKQKRKLEKALAKAKEIEPLFQRLNILFNIIKNEDLQNELFIKLVNDFDEYGNKITENQENNNKIINEFIDKSTKDKIKELIISNNNQLEYVYK
ncbi:hypothetical protein [Spiroplasma sp. AdecLV25b]|uniref:hypothetical protein n=1 Tax=Spiroplasma sp. AdecLV25b TaxID=3027162 RepID=UPI0027E0ACB3|nr:hypothetical protein [Spiroplasma sp. AdecLV25b]